jgi:FemAB-related protein (PEP-CTERM system-associated)
LVFGLKTYYLALIRESQVVGTCPLVRMKGWWGEGGIYLISTPFMTNSGILARDPEGEVALLEAASELAKASGAKYVEFRQVRPLAGKLGINGEHVDMVLELPSRIESLKKQLSPRLRQVRRAEREGVVVEKGRGEGLIRDFYRPFAVRMQELGFPVYPLRFFTEMARVFPEEAFWLTAYHQGRALGGMVCFQHRAAFYIPYVASTYEDRSLNSIQLLYWRAIEEAYARGVSRLHLGRSQWGSGTFAFKKQWGAAPVPLTYQYILSPDRDQVPSLNSLGESRIIQWGMKLWQRLPLSWTRVLGPVLVRRMVLA